LQTFPFLSVACRQISEGLPTAAPSKEVAFPPPQSSLLFFPIQIIFFFFCRTFRKDFPPFQSEVLSPHAVLYPQSSPMAGVFSPSEGRASEKFLFPLTSHPLPYSTGGVCLHMLQYSVQLLFPFSPAFLFFFSRTLLRRTRPFDTCLSAHVSFCDLSFIRGTSLGIVRLPFFLLFRGVGEVYFFSQFRFFQLLFSESKGASSSAHGP